MSRNTSICCHAAMARSITGRGVGPSEGVQTDDAEVEQMRNPRGCRQEAANLLHAQVTEAFCLLLKIALHVDDEWDGS